MKILLTIISTLLIILTVNAQSEKKLVRSGNGQYEDGNYSEAEVKYRKALDENPNYFNGKFNLGDAMYQQENFEESARLFGELAEANLSDEEKANVYYNMGNNLMKGQKWAEAVEAFKKTLRLNPGDYDAKYNLEYARKMMNDEQQQNQDQNQDQDQNKDQDQKDQENQDQNKDQQDQNEDQKDQEDKQDQQQNQDNQDNKDQKDQNQQQQQPQPQQISKEDAQKMLEALKNDEKNTLQKLQKEKAKAVKAKKSDIDW